MLKEKSRYVTLPWSQNLRSLTNRGPANMAEKAIKMTCMTFLCIIALRKKTVAHTFLPSFDNANGPLGQERLLRSRNFATILHLRNEKGTGVKMRPAIVSVASLLRTHQSAIGQLFSLCLVTVPEVFAKVNSVQCPSRF